MSFISKKRFALIKYDLCRFLFSHRLLDYFLWLIVLGSVFGFSYFIYLERTLPDPSTITSRRVSQSTKIFDSTGQTVLYDIHGQEKRTIVAWEDIAKDIKNAVLASEDSSFYSHGGLDLKGILRAFWRDVTGLSLSQGGSTITQQLVKNALLGQQKTISRKLREVILAVEIEKHYSKDELFSMYLNQIPFGSSIYGVESASLNFFGKKASEVSLSEAAILAATIKAPSYYSPYGNHVDALIGRRDFILNRMLTLNLISEKEARLALAEKPVFKKSIESISAPHFVLMVKDYLVQKYGEDMVENGGLKITTTLDSDLQKIAEEAVTKYSKINKEKYKASNSALVAIDPKTGGVLALVGSSDYFDVANQGNFNVVTSPNRQPGSSFKPFAYATAFAKGFTDYTVLFDVKTEFNPNCDSSATQIKDRYGLDCYHPQNYDGLYRGPVTMRQALSQSLNVPSVKTLYLANVEETISLARDMGITTLNGDYGLSLVLGGAEVMPIDLVSAYGVFANQGIKNNWNIIKKVEDKEGKALEEQKIDSRRVLDENIANLINDVLSDNTARSPVFGHSSSLYIPGKDVAAKTGTTQENRDAWVVGYAPNLAAGVWSGNNDNKSMTQAGAGISASGPLWHEFMAKALVKFPDERFSTPEPRISTKIMLNGSYIYSNNTSPYPEIHNILYYVDKNNPLGDFPTSPGKDPQFNNWEEAVRRFVGIY
jgi:1A family penicillin-binding protein